MENSIDIYQSPDHQTLVEVRFEEETVWLNQSQICELFRRERSVISKHISNVFKDGELDEKSNVQKMHIANSDKRVTFHNLDVIISVGYRVKSNRGTQFRQWATRRLKDFLIQGYAINEKRLQQKQQEVEYLKTGIRIISRAIEEQATQDDARMLNIFAKGLTLLDDYDHEQLDRHGNTKSTTCFPTEEEYLNVVKSMQTEFTSNIFAKPKDRGFSSSVRQIRQSSFIVKH